MKKLFVAAMLLASMVSACYAGRQMEGRAASGATFKVEESGERSSLITKESCEILEKAFGEKLVIITIIVDNTQGNADFYSPRNGALLDSAQEQGIPVAEVFNTDLPPNIMKWFLSISVPVGKVGGFIRAFPAAKRSAKAIRQIRLQDGFTDSWVSLQ